MYEPSPSGFDQPGLADVFNVPYQERSAGSAPESSPRPNHRSAILVGCLVGGIACITLVGGLGLCYRKRIRRRITGSESPPQETHSEERYSEERVPQEMDNPETFVPEMSVPEGAFREMDSQEEFVPEMGVKNICWELPAERKPVEMWTPTARSKGSPGSGHSRASWVPSDEGESPGGSSGRSQRTIEKLPPLRVR